MIKITYIEIHRFRSLMDLELDFDEDYNLVTICGKNNVGKTNVLRAVNLFFNQDDYEPQVDMPVFKSATGGSAIHPKITIRFFDDKSLLFYEIEKNWKDWNAGKISAKGKKQRRSERNWTNLKGEECLEFLGKIKFYFLEAANMIIPDMINEISDNMLTSEFNKSRFSQSKKELKMAYDKYVDGLQLVLDEFAYSISETFKMFKENWNVKFIVPKRSNSFRELISEDVELTINDQGSLGIEDKGSGLQRLASILLQIETAIRGKKGDTIIFCVDEPDIFLHEGMQKKLKEFFDLKAKDMQIIYTSHSKIFINTFNMKNVILLDAIIHTKSSVRKKRDINVIETKKVDITNEDGYAVICENLGIEKSEYNILERKNILVEGNCDKKYLEGLMRYFGLKVPNIISVNGANNIVKYLEFYESYYKNIDNYIPQIKVIYDNDSAGRDAYEKNQKKKYPHIIVKHHILQNVWGDANINSQKNATNNEVEDFVYPEVMCYLVNEILKKKGMNIIKSDELITQLSSPAFKGSGFMSLCEFYKNSANPQNGAEISFVSSGQATNQLKESLAGVFQIEGNKKLLNIIENEDKKYPCVKEELVKISNFE